LIKYLTQITFLTLYVLAGDNMKKSIIALALIPILGLTACGGSDTTETNETVEPVNTIPVVDVGVDQTVDAGQEVTITASVTDDDDVTTSWSQVSGTTVTFTQVDNNTITFIAPQLENQEILTFQITVDDGVNSTVTDSVDIIVSAQTITALQDWIINNEVSSSNISSAAGNVLVNVQVAEVVNVDENNTDIEYVYVETTGIPKYDVTVTQKIIDQLNQRPKAITDFRVGTTTAVADQIVAFGEDIGYNSSRENCTTTGGDGYWPPGPGCPTEQDKQAYFPVEPSIIAEDEEDCETGLGKIGLMVNGTSIYNWGDGMSEGDNLWYNLAPVAEQYDVDICGGHAAMGDYHHHFYTSCLADLVGDDGSEHSPVYGFSADGYPLYGPYESNNTLAISGWKTRDYGTDVTEGGCGTEGERSCVLVDPYDISKGVNQVPNGPDIGADVTTLSGNTLAAVDGYYSEDYYYAGETVEGVQLDENNGHDTNDGKGYHYHITLTKAQDDKLVPAFPYTIGPNFKGELKSNSITECGATMGGGGGGMPPPPMP
jgi:hypothetical protein